MSSDKLPRGIRLDDDAWALLSDIANVEEMSQGETVMRAVQFYQAHLEETKAGFREALTAATRLRAAKARMAGRAD